MSANNSSDPIGLALLIPGFEPALGVAVQRCTYARMDGECSISLETKWIESAALNSARFVKMIRRGRNARHRNDAPSS